MATGRYQRTSRKATPEVKEKGVPVGSLEPGETFTFSGNMFRLSGIQGDVAKVSLLEMRKVQISRSPARTKEMPIGVSRLEMPADTLVEKS